MRTVRHFPKTGTYARFGNPSLDLGGGGSRIPAGRSRQGGAAGGRQVAGRQLAGSLLVGDPALPAAGRGRPAGCHMPPAPP